MPVKVGMNGFGRIGRYLLRLMADDKEIQIAAINAVGLDSLPEELRALAELRLQNPFDSLRELGQKLTPPLSRSGVNHRLEKIIDLAARKD